MDRRVRILVTAGVVGALVGPVVLDRDSFPLSTYPMYSRTCGDAVTFATAQAVDAQGSASALNLRVIGDSDDPLVVAGELRRALREGRADARCIEIAERAGLGWAPGRDRGDRGRHRTTRRRRPGVRRSKPARPHGQRPLRNRADVTTAPSVDRQVTGSELWRIVDAQAPPERLAMLRILTGAFAVAYLAIRLPVFVQLAERASRGSTASAWRRC